jgi:hypothetical protein
MNTQVVGVDRTIRVNVDANDEHLVILIDF